MSIQCVTFALLVCSNSTITFEKLCQNLHELFGKDRLWTTNNPITGIKCIQMQKLFLISLTLQKCSACYAVELTTMEISHLEQWKSHYGKYQYGITNNTLARMVSIL